MPVNADEQNALDTFNRAFDLALQSGQIPKRLYDSSRRQSESKDAPIHRGSQAGGPSRRTGQSPGATGGTEPVSQERP